MFGVFKHVVSDPMLPIFRGFDDFFYAPHSRHTEVRAADIEKVQELSVIAASEDAGVHIVMANNGRQLFITGHSEYSPMTLDGEYRRDCKKGANIELPRNYYKNDDPSQEPVVQWKGHANLLFANWLNYYVYQLTPYDLSALNEE